MHCPALDCMGVVRQAPDARLSADLVDVQVVATTASAGGDSSSEPAPKRPKLGGAAAEAAAEAAVSGQVDVSVAGQDAANGNGTGECVDPAVPTAHAYASASAGDDGAQCTDLPIKSDNALGCPEVLRQVSPDRCVTVLDGPRAIDFLHQVELMCEKQPEIYTGFCQVLEETCQALAAAQDRQSTAADQTRLAAVTTSSSTSSSLRSRSLAEPNHLMATLLDKVAKLFDRHRSLYYEFLRFVPKSLLPKIANAIDSTDSKPDQDDHDQRWQVAEVLEAYDMSKHRWLLAKVRKTCPRRLLLHFIGWPNDHDSWYHMREQAKLLRPVSGHADVGPFLQLGRHQATNGMRMKDRVEIVLNTIGPGNQISLWSLVQWLSRPGSSESKLHVTGTKILKILDAIQQNPQPQQQHQSYTVNVHEMIGDANQSNENETGAAFDKKAAGILREKQLRTFIEIIGNHRPGSFNGINAPVEVDFAPGDFVETLNWQLEWVVAQVIEVVETPWHQIKIHKLGTSEAADEWIDEDETYGKFRKLKPYHRATTSGGAGMPKLGIFRETNTVTFANESVRELMRRSTRQKKSTDEPLLISGHENPLEVRDTGTIKNLGAFATHDIRKDEYIAEYCGEIISDKEMKQRGLASTSEYLFNLGAGLTIDASRFGNVTRYMNHSSQCNVRPMICNHFGCRRVVFYALEKIAAGDELTYDYGQEYTNNCKHLIV